MTDGNETPDAGGSPQSGHINWDEYESAVRTPEDVRNFDEWMEKEKAARIRELIRERWMAKHIRRCAGGGK